MWRHCGWSRPKYSRVCILWRKTSCLQTESRRDKGGGGHPPLPRGSWLSLQRKLVQKRNICEHLAAAKGQLVSPHFNIEFLPTTVMESTESRPLCRPVGICIVNEQSCPQTSAFVVSVTTTVYVKQRQNCTKVSVSEGAICIQWQ